MNTVSIDIKEEDLAKFTIANSFDLNNMTEEGHKKLFKEYPFKGYKNRMMGNDMITIQIPLTLYLLFRGYGLIV